MGAITQIDIRRELLIEILSMGVLHYRQEMKHLMDDVNAVRQDVGEYRSLIRTVDIALDVIEAVEDFDSSEFVSISANSKEVYTDGTTLVLKGGRNDND